MTGLSISELFLKMAIMEFVMFCLYKYSALNILRPGCAFALFLSRAMLYLILMAHFGLNLWRLIENLIDVVQALLVGVHGISHRKSCNVFHHYDCFMQYA